MRWPGKIPAGTTSDAMMMTIDMLPTIAAIVVADLPKHDIDGKNVWSLISGGPEVKNPHDFYATYYEQNQLQVITSSDGQWKLQLPHKYRLLDTTQPKASGGIPVKYKQGEITTPELYDLYADISESKNVAADHPEIVSKLQAYAKAMRAELGDSLMKQPKGSGTREAGQSAEN
jgi:arylsulfatase A-like enzyme